MKKRLTETKRASLEARFKHLKQVQAYFEAGKASNIVDRVSPEDPKIQGVVEALMRLMDAEPGTGYHVNKSASKRMQLASLVRRAFEEDDKPPMDKMPEDKPAMTPPPAPPMTAAPPMMGSDDDSASPMPGANPMEMMQPIEEEIQGMDDAQLNQEVQQLEDDLKNKMFGDGAAPVPPEKPPAPPMDKAPELSLAPEQKMALLMSLPAAKRLEKAAGLRALADALEMKEHQVSQNNHMTGNPNDALMHDYETEEEGSMKDTGNKVAALKSALHQLITASDEVDDENEDEKKEKEADNYAINNQAVLKLALRHLLASVEDLEKEKNESAEPKDEAGDGSPYAVERDEETNKVGTDEEDDKHVASLDEKRAILRAHLANLRQQKVANVDGKTMKTPKEVPNPSGTTEDQLKGDAKIQYSSATGEDGLEEIHDRRQKIPTDKEVTTTNGEPNELYFKNSPSAGVDRMTSEKDSSKDVNNKRVLKDEGTAVYNPTPTSPTDHMSPGAGSHQKTKDWEKAKSESDVTPHGDRLKGLAELVQMRTNRAMKLASKMAEAGQIKTQAQLQEQVVRLASYDDEKFEAVAEVFNSTSALSKKAEFPESFKAHEGDADDKKPPFAKKENDESDDSDSEDDEDEKPAFFDKKEAARALRRKASKDEDDYELSTRTPSRGVKQALMLGGDIPTAEGTPIAGALKKIAWSNPETKAAELVDLHAKFNGSINPGLV